MLISLRSDHKEHLQLLTTQPPQGTLMNTIHKHNGKILDFVFQ